MVAKRAYKIWLDEIEIEKAIATAWRHIAKHKDDYDNLCDQYSELSDKLKECHQKAEDRQLKFAKVYEEVNEGQLKTKELYNTILIREKVFSLVSQRKTTS